MKFHSKMLWHPDAKPAIPNALWHRAISFSQLLGTDKVAKVLHQGDVFYVCKARLAGAKGESDRACISEEEAHYVASHGLHRVGLNGS